MSSRSGAFPAPNVSRTTPLRGGEDEKRNERKKAAEIPGKMRRIAERRKRWVSGRDHMGEAGKGIDYSPTSVHIPDSAKRKDRISIGRSRRRDGCVRRTSVCLERPEGSRSDDLTPVDFHVDADCTNDQSIKVSVVAHQDSTHSIIWSSRGLTIDERPDSSPLAVERVKAFVRDLPRSVSSPDDPVEEETNLGQGRERPRDDETREQVREPIRTKR